MSSFLQGPPDQLEPDNQSKGLTHYDSTSG